MRARLQVWTSITRVCSQNSTLLFPPPPRGQIKRRALSEASPLRENYFHNFFGLGAGYALVLCALCNHGIFCRSRPALLLHPPQKVAAQPQFTAHGEKRILSLTTHGGERICHDCDVCARTNVRETAVLECKKVLSLLRGQSEKTTSISLIFYTENDSGSPPPPALRVIVGVLSLLPSRSS